MLCNSLDQPKKSATICCAAQLNQHLHRDYFMREIKNTELYCSAHCLRYSGPVFLWGVVASARHRWGAASALAAVCRSGLLKHSLSVLNVSTCLPYNSVCIHWSEILTLIERVRITQHRLELLYLTCACLPSLTWFVTIDKSAIHNYSMRR